MSFITRIASRVFSSLKMLGTRIGGNVRTFVRRLPYRKNNMGTVGTGWKIHKAYSPDQTMRGVFPLFSQPNTPFSTTMVLIGMTLLTGLSFKGQLPFEDYNNATFSCELDGFKGPMGVQISHGYQLSINGQLVPDGECLFRKTNLPFAYFDMWEGELTLGKGVKTKFFILNNTENEFVPTEFSEIVKSENNLLIDIEAFLKYDVDLGYTFDFEIDTNNSEEFIKMKFTIKDIGQFDVKMAAVETYGDGYPLIGTYEFENDQFYIIFNLRRENVFFYIESNGLIEFKQPKNGLSSIFFATNGHDMRFQGEKAIEKNHHQLKMNDFNGARGLEKGMLFPLVGVLAGFLKYYSNKMPV